MVGSGKTLIRRRSSDDSFKDPQGSVKSNMERRSAAPGIPATMTSPKQQTDLPSDAVTPHLNALISTLRGALEQTDHPGAEKTSKYSNDNGSTVNKSASRPSRVSSIGSRASSIVSSAAVMDAEEEVRRLKTTVALLQDENGSLKSEVRALKSFLAEHYPNALKHPEMPGQQPRPYQYHQRQIQRTKSTREDVVGEQMMQVKKKREMKDEREDENALFDKFVVVEFVEDSPMLRRKMSAFEEGIEGLRVAVKDLVKNAQAFWSSGMRDLETVLALAESLEAHEITTLAPLMHELSQVLKRLAQLKENMLMTLQMELTNPLGDFVKNDIRQAQDMRRELERARDVYETLESKYMHHRRTKQRSSVISNVGRARDAVEDQLFGELQSAKARFELARFGLIQQLNQLEAKKRFVLLDRAVIGMSSFLTYFREGYQMLASHAPMVEAIRETVGKAQKSFDISVEKWNEKRIQLESQLHSGAFPFMSKERRLLNMSKPHEKVTVESSASRTTHDPGVIYEGYLYKRSSSVRKDWKRRWFVLKGDQLLYYRGWKDPTPHPVCDILLCTVREVKNAELRCCFEIISPTKRPYMLQAVNENIMDAWMDAIRRAIESQLVKQQQRPSLSRTSGKSDPEVSLLLTLNSKCADCNTENPDWVSLNLGAVICIVCSGIHRSLGTHLSKVRSVTLDQLPRSQLTLLRRLGNASVNKVWEHGLDEKEKPLPNAQRSEKETFIRAKYQEKKFIDTTFAKTKSQSDQVSALFQAVSDDDLEGVMICIANGVPLDSIDSDGMTPMHVAAANNNVEICELLFLNGANLDAQNTLHDNITPLQIAMQENNVAVVDVLERNLSATSSFKSSTSSPSHRRSLSHPNSVTRQSFPSSGLGSGSSSNTNSSSFHLRHETRDNNEHRTGEQDL